MHDQSLSARCSHIKRRIIRDEPLKGGLLELALYLTGDDRHEDDL
ncbi:hypothetical protein [Kiloniella sp.]